MGVIDASWKNMNFNWFLMLKFKAWCNNKTSLAGVMLYFTRFAWLRTLMKDRWPKGFKSHQNQTIGRPWSICFEIWGGLERMCFLMSFWIRKKSAHFSTNQRRWQTNWKTTVGLVGVGGRGGVLGKRKSWGFEDWRAFSLGFSTPHPGGRRI